MAKENLNTPVVSQMFGGGKKQSGSSLPMAQYKGEAKVNSQARGPGAHNSLNSPAPSKMLGSMPDDDRKATKGS